MDRGTTLNQLASRRKLGFLSTLEKKIQNMRREAEKLDRATQDPGAQGAQRSLGELDRIIRGLIGAGPVYGLEAISVWAKKTLSGVETLRIRKTLPSEVELVWLASEIQELEQLVVEEVKEAEVTIGDSWTRPPTSPRDGRLSGIDAKPPSSLGEAPSYPPTGREMTITALVIAEQLTIRQKAAYALSHAGFEVRELNSGKEAMSLARQISPDVIIVDMDDPPPDGASIVAALARESLTNAIPVIRLASEARQAAHNSLQKPLNPEKLVALAKEVTGQGFQGSPEPKSLSDLNLEELSEFVGSEIRSGVLEAATGSHIRDSFPVLEKGQVIASVWSLIARLRRVAAEGSKGRIRFIPPAHGPIDMMALDEAEGVLDPLSHEFVDESDIEALLGLHAVVADDDEEIQKLFYRVLSDAGMQVRTANNGVQALAQIRENPPDVIITDILMPEMDGWELTTRIRWNYALKHIPIIMLSWKEDFLQRVRELNGEADAFMLKEVDRQQIYRRVAGVLKPRFTLERRLIDEGEVTGRIERVGVVPLLRAAMALRPDSRITLRENWNYFEVDFSGGELAAINRTGTDGSFATGMPALDRLLGVSSGRFAVVSQEEISKRQFPDGTASAIVKATLRLNKLNNHVVDGALMNIVKMEMDEEVVGIYTKVIPHKLKKSLRCLIDGKRPRDIVLDASTSAERLETLLLDLIRMGAITKIESAETSKARDDLAEIDEAEKEGFPEIHVESTLERNSANTIPIDLDDLSEIITTTGKTPLPPLLGTTRGPKIGTLRVWQILAALFFGGFVAIVILFANQFTKADTPEPRLETLVAKSDPPAPESLVEPVQEPYRSPTLEPAAPPPEAELSNEEEEIEQPSAQIPSVSAKKTEPEPKLEFDRVPSREKRKRKSEHRRREKSESTRSSHSIDTILPQEKSAKKDEKSDEAKESSPPPLATGTLVISEPNEAPGRIKVSVDGKVRGHAPLRLTLTPGLHEIVYSYEGKRVMRMVSIRADGERKIRARVPQ